MALTKKNDLFNGMQFFMRPCSSKGKMRELVEENSGSFVNKMSHGVIRLTDNSADSQGIRVEFVLNSIQNGKLEDMKKYDVEKTTSTTNTLTVSKSSLEKARKIYQPEEDEAMMQYVLAHKADYGEEGSIGGNILWREMERQKITCHSWQSMKHRYNRYLCHRKPTFSFQPLTMRTCGNSFIQYAISRDSPVTDESFDGGTLSRGSYKGCHNDDTQQDGDNQKNLGKRKKKKMYTKSDELFSDTPFKPSKKKIIEQEKNPDAQPENEDSSSGDDILVIQEGSSEEEQTNRDLSQLGSPQEPQEKNNSSNNNESHINSDSNNTDEQSENRRKSSRIAANSDSKNQSDTSQEVVLERQENRNSSIINSENSGISLYCHSDENDFLLTRRRKRSSSKETKKTNENDVADSEPNQPNHRNRKRKFSQDSHEEGQENTQLTCSLLKLDGQSTIQETQNNNNDGTYPECNINSREENECSQENTITRRKSTRLADNSRRQETPNPPFKRKKKAKEKRIYFEVSSDINGATGYLDVDSSNQKIDDSQECHSKNNNSISPQRKSTRLNPASRTRPLEESLRDEKEERGEEKMEYEASFTDDDAVSIIVESQELFLNQDIGIGVNTQPASPLEGRNKFSNEEKNKRNDEGKNINKCKQPNNNDDTQQVQHSTNSQSISEFSSSSSTNLFQSYTSEEASPRNSQDSQNSLEEGENIHKQVSQKDDQEGNSSRKSPLIRNRKKIKENKATINANNDTQPFDSPESNARLKPIYSSTLVKNNCNSTHNNNIGCTSNHRWLDSVENLKLFDDSCSDGEGDKFDKELMRKAVNARPKILELSEGHSSSNENKRKSYFDNWNPPFQCDCYEKKEAELAGIDFSAGYKKYLERVKILLREKMAGVKK